MQIVIKNIFHTFSKNQVTEFLALKNVSAEINQGEFITIIGKTGSGKTTFIEHLNALLRPDKGSVHFYDLKLASELRRNKRKVKKGHEISSDAFNIHPGKMKLREIKKLRKRIGVVFQFAEYQLFEETIEKDIIFGPMTMGISKEDAIKAAKKYISLVGMDKSFLQRSPFQLSGGQKRRIALAGILAMEPDILIFDEPTAGLDPQGEKDMYDIFHKLHKLGKTLVIVTHNMDHVLEHSERTIVFNDSEVVRDDKSLSIMYDYDFLEKNELDVPKIVDVYIDLIKKDFKLKQVKNITQLANQINKQRR